MSGDHSRMDKEVRTAELMINIFCHGQHGKKEGLCPECRGFLTMSRDALKDAPFGKTSPDARNALYIAINLI
jgi:hypothetical protein